MADETSVVPFTEAEVQAVGGKLLEWSQTLTPREQQCLATLLDPEATRQEADVGGYATKAAGMRPSTRTIVEVIFSYTNRNTDFTEKFSR